MENEIKKNPKFPNLYKLEKGQSFGKGRGKGNRNKANVAREVLEMTFKAAFKKHPKYEQLLKRFPEIQHLATCEQVMNLIQVEKAIFEGSTIAFAHLMNRARGNKLDGSDNTLTIELPSEEVSQQLLTKLGKKF